MTSNRLKSLARLRLILSVVALLLAGLMIVSGIMYFGAGKPAFPEDEPAESTVESTDTVASDPTETTEATNPSETTEHTEPAETTVDTEPTETTGETESAETAETTAPDDTDSEIEGTLVPKPGSGFDLFPNKDHHNSGSKEEQETTAPAASETQKDENPDVNDGIAVGSLSANFAEAAPIEHPGNEIPAEDTSAEPTEHLQEGEELNIGTAIGTKPEKDPGTLWCILFWTSGALLMGDLVAIVVLSGQIKKANKRLSRVRKSLDKTNEYARQAIDGPSPSCMPPSGCSPIPSTEFIQPLNQVPRVGTVHQVGRRDYQQDSLGHISVLDDIGFLAVLADGMGGLSSGERVSQKIVMDALEMGHHLKPEQTNGVLWKMVEKINANVNQMLGPDGLYKSGSTLLAVLAYNGKFQWIAVGDSRIYLYRQGYANQLNHDHDQLQVWMADVLSGRRTMEDALRNPDGKKLTSFIGMGQLKYIDGSRGAIALEPGDRLVLMSDGVYNVISETALAGVLKRYPDVEQAASVMDRMIREHNHPHQDNYTAIVLGF